MRTFINGWRGYKYNLLAVFPIRIWIRSGFCQGRGWGSGSRTKIAHAPNKKKLHVLKLDPDLNFVNPEPKDIRTVLSNTPWSSLVQRQC